MALSEGLAQLLLPRSHCLGCGHPRSIDEGDILCAQCEQELAAARLSGHVCPQCLSPRANGSPCAYCLEGGMAGIQAAYAPFHYHGIVQRLVVTLKFGMDEDAAEPLGRAMADCVRYAPVDALVPVPLHKARLRERGFNQAETLARIVEAQTGDPVLPALRRTINTRRQSSLLSPLRRERNVADAFEPIAPVDGLRLMLVDDVRTTGATARSCAAALLAAGAKEVYLLTAAVAPPRSKKRGISWLVCMSELRRYWARLASKRCKQKR